MVAEGRSSAGIARSSMWPRGPLDEVPAWEQVHPCSITHRVLKKARPQGHAKPQAGTRRSQAARTRQSGGGTNRRPAQTELDVGCHPGGRRALAPYPRVAMFSNSV